MAIGDLNHDGNADLVWWNNSTGQVYGMLMNGTTIGSQGMMYAEPNTAWQIVANGDYSGDGNADLLWRNSQTGQVYEMTMNGLTVTGGAQIYQEANTDWRILAKAPGSRLPTQATAGVDYASLAGEPLNPHQSLPDKPLNPPKAGIGQDDTRNAVNSGAVKMAATALASAPIATLVQSGDFNGDGKADLIWQNTATGQVYEMLLNGFEIAQQGMIYHEPNTAWRIVQNGDFTGDGQSELLWWNSSTGQVYLMRLNFSDTPSTPISPRIDFVSDQTLLFNGIGQSANLQVRVFDPTGQEIPDAQVSWSSSAPGTVAITATGPLTAKVDTLANWSSPITLTVTYAPLNLIAQAQAVMAVMAPDAVLTSSNQVLDIQGDRTGVHQVILARTAATEALKVGQVIVTGDEAGVMVRILGITLEPTRVVLLVEPALITEAFRDVDFSTTVDDPITHLSIQITQRDTIITLRSLPDNAIISQQVLQSSLIDKLVENCTGGLDVEIMKGKLEVSELNLDWNLTPRSTLKINNYQLVDLMLQLEGKATVTANVTIKLAQGVTMSGVCSYKPWGKGLSLRAIPPWGPISIQPTLPIELGVKVSASAEGVAESVLPATFGRSWQITTGVHWTPDLGWQKIADYSVENKFIGGDGDLKTSLQVKVEPFAKVDTKLDFNVGVWNLKVNLASIKFFGLTGGFYYQVGINQPVDPVLKDYSGPTVEAGIEAEAKVQFKDEDKRLEKYLPISMSVGLEFPLFSEHVPWYKTVKPTGSVACNPNCSGVPTNGSGTVTLTATSTDLTANGTVEFWASRDNASQLIQLSSAVPFVNGSGEASFVPNANTGTGSYTVFPRLRLNGAEYAYTRLWPLASAQPLGAFSIGGGTYIVTATAGANGSITPASQTVNAGATTTFTVTPDSGYTASVSGCGGTLSGTTYTTGAITAACTVAATFSQGGCGEGQIIKVNGVDRYRVVGSDCSIVADLVTGLEWQRCSVGLTWDASIRSCDGPYPSGFTWDQAMTQTAPGGFRLPTLTELGSLVYCPNTGTIGLTVPQGAVGYSSCYVSGEEWWGDYQHPTIVWEAFPKTFEEGPYWSSSSASTANAGIVWFRGSLFIAYPKDRGLVVRLVRGGQSSASLPNTSVTSQTSLSPSKSTTPLWSALPPTLRSLLSDAQAPLSSPQVSADGRVIVFATDAALLPEDNNGVSDIYRFTVAKGQLQRLSVSQDGQSANAASHSPRLDASGQRVVFLSAVTNLTRGLPGTADQLYLHDEQIGGLLRLSETPSGEPADAAITHPLIDAAGQQVVYRSAAHNLADGPGLYRYDLRSGLRQPIAVDEQGQPDPRADVPAADAALALIAYQRPAANGLGAESTQVYLYDPAKSVALPVSEFFDGAGQSVAGCCASVSPDGGYLAWRETTAEGERRLVLIERASGRRSTQSWPQAEALAEQAPVFRNGNRELWWVAPLQGPGSEPVLQRMQNPLMEAAH